MAELRQLRAARKVTVVTPNPEGYTPAASHPNVWPAGRGVIVPRASPARPDGISSVSPDTVVQSVLGQQVADSFGNSRLQYDPLQLDRKKVTPELSKKAFALAAAEVEAEFRAGKLTDDDLLPERTRRAYAYLVKLTTESTPPPSAAGMLPQQPIAKKNAMLRTPTPVPSRPTASKALPTTKPPVVKEESLQAAFEKLGISGLGPTAAKPGFRVEFDLGDAGRQAAFYHWVAMDDKNGLYLIFDRRFDVAEPYSPPTWSIDRTFTVQLQPGGQEPPHTVYNMGWRLQFGVFDIQILILAPNNDEASEFDEDQAMSAGYDAEL